MFHTPLPLVDLSKRLDTLEQQMGDIVRLLGVIAALLEAERARPGATTIGAA